MSMLKRLLLLLFFLLTSVSLFAQTDSQVEVTFEDYFFSDTNNNLLDGSYAVTASLVSDSGLVYQEKLPADVEFDSGLFSVSLGVSSELFVSSFNVSNLYLRLEVENGDTSTYSITALPYVIHAKTAETALSVTANRIYGDFTNPFLVAGDLIVSQNSTTVLSVDGTSQRVGISTASPSYALEVIGTVNASSLLIDGIIFKDSTAWQEQSTASENIYYDDGFVGIGDAFPNTLLRVGDIVNAETFLIDGDDITAGLDWTETSSPTSAYYEDLSANVGLGISSPLAKLDINGAIIVAVGTTSNAGTIYWDGTDFYGVVTENGQSKSLTGIRGFGSTETIPFWSGSSGVETLRLDYNDSFYFSDDNVVFGINDNNPDARLSIIADETSSLNLVSLTDSSSNSIFKVNEDGRVLLLGAASTNALIDIEGQMNADSLYLDGVPLSLVITKGTYWYLAPTLNSRNDVYLFTTKNAGISANIGIGTPSPNRILELGQINQVDDMDVAITFTNDAEEISYTMGLNHENNYFSVVPSKDFDGTFPVFTVKRSKFGIGVSEPLLNLHVSGNEGIIIQGNREGRIETIDLDEIDAIASGAGTRLMFDPNFGSMRAGTLDENSPYSGEDWDKENLGVYSVAMGYNNVANGNQSAALGGSYNEASGQAATVPGGFSNKANGFFSVALGSRAITNHQGTFVYADTTDSTFQTSTEDAFIVRADNGVGINTNNTSIFNSETLNTHFSGLTIGAVNVITSSNLIDYAPTSTITSAGELFDALVLSSAIDSDGNISDSLTESSDLGLSSPLNTNETDLLTYLISYRDKHLVKAGDSTFISKDGHLIVGTSNVTTGSLIVIGQMGINTTTPLSTFHVQPINEAASTTDPVLSDPILYIEQSASTTPAMVITRDGRVALAGGRFSSEDDDSDVILSIPTLNAAVYEFSDGSTISATGNVLVWQQVTPVEAVPSTAFTSITGSDSESAEVWNNLIEDSFLNDDGYRIQDIDSSDDLLTHIDNYDANASDIYTVLVSYRLFDDLLPGIYFTSGNVGIGTLSPGSLLELSNVGAGNTPEIGFEIDDSETFSFGLNKNNTNLGFYPDYSSTSNTFIMNSSGNIGINTHSPENNLQVEDYAVITGTLSAASDEVITGDYAVNATALNSTLYAIDGDISSPFDINDDSSIYTSDLFVGLGTRTPNADLEIAGTLNVISTKSVSVYISDQLQFLGGLNTNDLSVQDKANLSEYYDFYVDNSDLYMSIGSTPISLTSPLSKGTGSEGSTGSVVIWTPSPTSDSIISQSDLVWTTPYNDGSLDYPGQLSISGQFELISSATIGTSLAETVYRLHSDDLLYSHYLDTQLTNLSDIAGKSSSYTAQSIYALINDWDSDASTFNITGAEVNINNLEDSFFTGSGTGIGLRSDVSGVGLQTIGKKGYAYSAIFLGPTGNVGIGGTPNVALEVFGSVSVTEGSGTFNISQRLTVSSMNFGTNDFVAREGLVGINTETPRALLDINGDFIANTLRTSGLNGQSLLVNNASFVVNTDGQVGMGTTDPSAQWQLSTFFDKTAAQTEDNFTFQTISINSTVSRNITALDVSIDSYQDPDDINTSNYLGLPSSPRDAIGVNVDLSGLELFNSQDYLVGLYVSGNKSSVNTQNLAIFRGGPVGINTLEPSSDYALEVNGLLRVTHVPDILDFSDIESASFNSFTITDNGNLIPIMYAEDMHVGLIYQEALIAESLVTLNDKHLSLSSSFNSIQSTFSTLNVTDITIVDSSTISTASFSSLAVGQTDITASLNVTGGFETTSLEVLSALSGQSLTLGDNDFFVGSDAIGLNTATPESTLHSALTRSGSFDASDVRTWANAVFQTSSNTSNSAAGISLHTETNQSSTTGAGFAAIRGNSPTGSSQLVFMTTDDNISREWLRFTSTGNIGINETDPSALLDVNGDAIFDADLNLASDLIASNIEGISNLLVPTLTIQATMNIIGGLGTEGGFLISSGAARAANTTYNSLYVLSSDDSIYYNTILSNGNEASGTLGSITTSNPDTFPYYDTNGKLISTQVVNWISDSISSVPLGIFRVGTTNYDTFSQTDSSAKQVAFISSTNTSLDIAPYQLRGSIARRTNTSDSLFVGTQIQISNQLDSDLLPEDTLTGLLVNFDDSVLDSYTDDEGAPKSGTFIAATFLNSDPTVLRSQVSGNVYINSSENASLLAPRSELYILGEVSDQSLMLIQSLESGSSTTRDAFSINSDGFVGFGTATPTSARAVVQSQASDETALTIQNSSEETLLTIYDDKRLGLGITEPVYDELGRTSFEISGTISANRLHASSELRANSLTVSDSDRGFYVLGSGLIGIGTNTPDAQLHFTQDFPAPANLTDDYTATSVNLSILTDINSSITGYGIDMRTTDGWVFGDQEESGVGLIGLNVDFTDLTGGSDATYTGLYVSDFNAPYDETSTSSHSAIFLGGNVGVGIEEPTVALDASGLIVSANNGVFTSVSLNNIQGGLSNLYVSDNSEIAYIDTLYQATGNTLYVSTTLTVNESASFSTSGNIDLFESSGLFATRLNTDTLAVPSSISYSDLGSNTSNIEGDIFFNGPVELTNSNAFQTNTITGDTVHFSSPLTITATLNMTNPSHAISFDHLRVSTSDITALNEHGLLAVSENKLIYRFTSSTSSDQSVTISALSASEGLPYFSGDPLSSTPLVGYSSGSDWNSLSISSDITVDSPSSFLLITSNITTDLNTSFTAHEISVLFQSRRLANLTAPRTFSGLSIDMDGIPTTSHSIVGLRVNMDNIQAEGSTEFPDPEDSFYTASKSIAQFLAGDDTSGNTLIIPSVNTASLVPPSASLHIIQELSNPALRTDSIDDFEVAWDDALIVENSSVGIGTTNASSRLTVRGKSSDSSDYALRIKDSSDTALVSLYNSGFLGLGTETPESLLHVSQLDSDTDILRVSSPSSNFVLVDSAGNLGLSTDSPETLFHELFVTENFIFKTGTFVDNTAYYSAEATTLNNLLGCTRVVHTVSPNNVVKFYDVNCSSSMPDTITYDDVPLILLGNSLSDPDLILEQNGVLELGYRYYEGAIPNNAPRFRVIVSSNVVSGIPDSSSDYSTEINTTSNNHVFMAAVGDEAAWIGTIDNHNYLTFGDDDSDFFRIEKTTGLSTIDTVMSLSGSGNVEIGSASLAASLNIQAGSDSVDVLRLSSNSSPNILVINDAGLIGIGSEPLTSNLYVSGNIRTVNFENYTITGTEANFLTTNVTAIEKSTANLLIDKRNFTNLGINGQVEGENVDVFISGIDGEDTVRGVDVIGVYVSINSTTQTPTITGLAVDLSDLQVINPFIQNTSSGNLYAATFLGGPFGIEEEYPSDDATLQMSADGARSVVKIQNVYTELGNSITFNVSLISSGNYAREIPLKPESFENLDFVQSQTATDNFEYAISLWETMRNYTFSSPGGDVPILIPSMSAGVGVDDASYYYTNGNSEQISDAFSFLSSSAQEEIEDLYDRHSVGSSNDVGYILDFSVQDGVNTSTLGGKLFLASGINATDSTEGIGFVGIGMSPNTLDRTTDPLTVSGDIRLGTKAGYQDGITFEAGYGNLVYFSGGSLLLLTSGSDTDNNDDLFIGRYNQLSEVSELRLNYGSDDVSVPRYDKFRIGSVTPTYNEQPLSMVVGTFYDDIRAEYEGRIGIATENPSSVLHIVGSTSSNNSSFNASDYLAVVENTSTDTSHRMGIAINHSSTTAIDSSYNFASFFASSNSIIGRIEGNYGEDDFETQGGVVYSSGNADYAEYLKKYNPEEQLKAGDVVGVKDGLISLSTKAASQYMVISSKPVVVGNFPGQDQLDNYGLVSFMGQVPIRVRGPVAEGDYLIPSGFEDGTAIAVSPKDIAIDQVPTIIGKSWQAFDDELIHSVDSVVGFPFQYWAYQDKLQELKSLKEKVLQLTNSTQETQDKYNRILKERITQIASLEALLDKQQ